MSHASSLQLPEDNSHDKGWGEYLAQYMFAARHIKDCSVLDIGCQKGFGSRYLFDQGASEVLGVDGNSTNIRNAAHLWGCEGVTYSSTEFDIDRVEGEQFDAITCFRVLETSRNPDRLLKQLCRLLKKGGSLYVSTTNRTHLSKLQETPLVTEHIQEFNSEEFQELLKMHFPQVEIFGQFCTRPNLANVIGEQASVLDFLKSGIDNYVPWKIRERVSETLLGVPYYPQETEFILRKQNIGEAPILYAFCKK